LISNSKKNVLQQLQPNSTVNAGGWITSSQGTDLHNFTDELAANDSESIFSSQSPSDDLAILNMQAGNQPTLSGDHAVLVRARKESSDSSILQLTVRLVSGQGLIDEWIINLEQIDVFTTFEFIVDPSMIQFIDYSDIQIDLIANTIDASSPSVNVSWVQLQIR